MHVQNVPSTRLFQGSIGNKEVYGMSKVIHSNHCLRGIIGMVQWAGM